MNSNSVAFSLWIFDTLVDTHRPSCEKYWVKMPVKGKVPVPEILRLHRSMGLWIKALMMVSIGYIEWAEIQTALRRVMGSLVDALR